VGDIRCNKYRVNASKLLKGQSPVTTSTTPQIGISTWNIDPAHSVAEFKIRHMMISNVKGQFTRVAGTLFIDEADTLKSRVEASIDAASISTGDPERDAHLKSAEFFDVEKFPTLLFKSIHASRSAGGNLTVQGELTIRDVTRKVAFDVEGPTAPAKDPWGNTRLGLSATTKINRKDFGLNWNAALETGGILVGDELTITLEVQFVKA
jgi:polyisoprenoid-binding protein YceI